VEVNKLREEKGSQLEREGSMLPWGKKGKGTTIMQETNSHRQQGEIMGDERRGLLRKKQSKFAKG